LSGFPAALCEYAVCKANIRASTTLRGSRAGDARRASAAYAAKRCSMYVRSARRSFADGTRAFARNTSNSCCDRPYAIKILDTGDKGADGHKRPLYRR
jgi:hypothetical protein